MTQLHLSHLASSPALACFEEFYYHIIEQKQKAFERTSFNDAALEQIKESDENFQTQRFNALQTAQTIQKNLKIVIEHLAVRYANLTGGLKPHVFDEVHYIMVALADEIFLSLPFEGAQEWRLSLLEGQYFHTQIAGEVIFKKIDSLLESHDVIRYELGQIYLFALSLGFKGMYADPQEFHRLQWYKDQLYILICHEVPQNFVLTSHALVDQCYTHNVVGAPSRGLVDARSWAKYALILGGLYLLTSHVLWKMMTLGVKQDINHILSVARLLKG